MYDPLRQRRLAQDDGNGDASTEPAQRLVVQVDDGSAGARAAAADRACCWRWSCCSVFWISVLALGLATAGLIVAVRVTHNEQLEATVAEYVASTIGTTSLRAGVAGRAWPVQLVLDAGTGARASVVGASTSGSAVLLVAGTLSAGQAVASDRVDYVLRLGAAPAAPDLTLALWFLAPSNSSGGGALRHVQGSPLGGLTLVSAGTFLLPPGVATVAVALQVSTPAWQTVVGF